MESISRMHDARTGESEPGMDDEPLMTVRPGPAPTTPEREERIRDWGEKNAAALDAHNDFVRRHGVPFAASRRF